MPDLVQSTAAGRPPMPPLSPPLDTEPDDPSPSGPPWDDSAGWRETYLYSLREADQALLRRFSEMLIELVRESGMLAESPESATAQEMWAAADLRQLYGFLSYVGREADENCLDRQDTRLSDLAQRLAPTVGQVADEIEAALVALGPDPS